MRDPKPILIQDIIERTGISNNDFGDRISTKLREGLKKVVQAPKAPLASRAKHQREAQLDDLLSRFKSQR